MVGTRSYLQIESIQLHSMSISSKHLIVISTILLSACASVPKEEFTESFFTYQDDSGKKLFSFILKLDNAGHSGSYLDRIVNEEANGQNNRKQQKRSRERMAVARPENPEDEKVSLKFRMEELAYQKLLAKLEEVNYCDSEVEFSENEFERNRYKIKGYCQE